MASNFSSFATTCWNELEPDKIQDQVLDEAVKEQGRLRQAVFASIEVYHVALGRNFRRDSALHGLVHYEVRDIFVRGRLCLLDKRSSELRSLLVQLCLDLLAISASISEIRMCYLFAKVLFLEGRPFLPCFPHLSLFFCSGDLLDLIHCIRQVAEGVMAEPLVHF